MIQVYASERRMRDAEIQLAKSQSESDIRWQVGARRFEETGDTALVVGVSMPLFAGRRNRGEVQAAAAARDEAALRVRAAKRPRTQADAEGEAAAKRLANTQRQRRLADAPEGQAAARRPAAARRR